MNEELSRHAGHEHASALYAKNKDQGPHDNAHGGSMKRLQLPLAAGNQTKTPAPEPDTAEAGLPLKRPPPLHVMAQRVSALSPGRTRSSGGSPGRGAGA